MKLIKWVEERVKGWGRGEGGRKGQDSGKDKVEKGKG